MKIILDTNVLASGIFFPGVPLRILQGIKQGKYSTVVTSDIVDEYKRTITKLANDFPGVDATAQLELFVVSSEICQPKILVNPVCEDPDDDKFIACAIASKTKIIVSGDKHLLKISGYQNVRVLKPRAFSDRYLR